MNKYPLLPYSMVWDTKNEMPGLVVEIEDCDVDIQSQYDENKDETVPVAYFTNGILVLYFYYFNILIVNYLRDLICMNVILIQINYFWKKWSGKR